MIRILGDVHGKYTPYKKLIRKVPRSIQVGDMGVGFRLYSPRTGEIEVSTNPPFDSMAKGDHRFIRGNHDNPEVCRRHKFCIPDGAFWPTESIFFLGGAVSVDREYRTEGLDWWRDEELSYEELDKAIKIYEATKPRIVITHECPESIADEILMAFNRVKILEGSRTRQALQAMLEIHRPELWVFGHWHHDMDVARAGTRFVCLGELSYIDLDPEKPFEGSIVPHTS